jgi:hypothetical protein
MSRIPFFVIESQPQAEVGQQVSMGASHQSGQNELAESG